MRVFRMSLCVALLLPGVAFTAPAPGKVQKGVERVQDRAAFQSRLRALGFKKKGGIAKDKTDHDDARHKSFAHFTSSFNYRGTDYPYTMVGHPPASGKTTNLKTVIIRSSSSQTSR